MTFQPTPTMNSLDAMFDELFGPKLLPDIAAPGLPDLTPAELSEGDYTQEIC